MYSDIIDVFEGKRIAILGFGAEGISTYNFIRKHLPNQKLVIMDQNYQNIVLNDDKVLLMEVDYSKMDGIDLIVKTPGISFKNVDTSSFIDKVTSQLELFLEFRDCFTIGVTGSKGKSTTSSLIHAAIEENGLYTYLVGNIGKPIFDVLVDVYDDSIVVIEMSSHQLEFVKHSPDIGIILNLFEEHLDHYKDVETYYMAKMNICKYQAAEDYFLYTSDNATLNEYANNINVSSMRLNITDTKQINSSIYIENGHIVSENKTLFKIKTPMKLQGKHNIKNIMFVLKVAQILHLDMSKVVKAICEFEPLPHRMELVGTYNDITYYNDSIATIPNATVNGIETLSNVNTLIIGGMNREINYKSLVDFINSSDIEHLICMPETGTSVGKEITGRDVHNVADLKEAVVLAKKITKPGTICLLSPAAASYGIFKNFEERGNLFKEYVRNEEIK